MLLSSGLSFGFRRSLPALFGVVCGFCLLSLSVGFGLRTLFLRYPVMELTIKSLGVGYMLYLAWVIARSAPPDPGSADNQQPIGFLRAVALQWVNPKAVATAAAAFANYSGVALYPYNIVILVSLHCGVTLISAGLWTGMGMILQRLLHKPKIVRGFNILMAFCLVASLYPTLAQGFLAITTRP